MGSIYLQAMCGVGVEEMPLRCLMIFLIEVCRTLGNCPFPWSPYQRYVAGSYSLADHTCGTIRSIDMAGPAGLGPVRPMGCIFSFGGATQVQTFLAYWQWPGSYCDTQQRCCYPSSGKPAADFGIHGLWPNYNDGSYPSNCDPSVPFNPSKISDLVDSMQTNWPSLACPSSDGNTFWSHEWTKHGTCSESVLDEHGYFNAALNLRNQVNLLQALRNSGIEPNDQSYSLNSISQAISDATGYIPGIECNRDESGNDQLYQVYVCVDTSGTSLTDCPVLPHGKCSSQIHFPSF